MPRAASQTRRTRPSRYRLTWRDWTLEVRHQPDYLTSGQDHIEVEVKAPPGAPIPITSTGYRSHFLDPAGITEAGGVVAYVTAWLDAEARTKAWAKTEQQWRQLSFDLVMPAKSATTPAPKRRRKPAPWAKDGP